MLVHIVILMARDITFDDNYYSIILRFEVVRSK